MEACVDVDNEDRCASDIKVKVEAFVSDRVQVVDKQKLAEYEELKRHDVAPIVIKPESAEPQPQHVQSGIGACW
jgi:hypothetical protein